MALDYDSVMGQLISEVEGEIESNPDIGEEGIVSEVVYEFVYNQAETETLENVLSFSPPQNSWQGYCDDMNLIGEVRCAMAYTSLKNDILSQIN